MSDHDQEYTNNIFELAKKRFKTLGGYGKVEVIANGNPDVIDIVLTERIRIKKPPKISNYNKENDEKYNKG